MRIYRASEQMAKKEKDMGYDLESAGFSTIKKTIENLSKGERLIIID